MKEPQPETPRPRVPASGAVAEVAEHWNKRATGYHDCHLTYYTTQIREQWRLVYQQAVATLFPSSNRTKLKVLDVGTGTGFLSTLLAELGHEVTGIDLAPQMLGYAREEAQRRGVELRLGLHGANEVPALGREFDLVTARYVLWTLPDPAAALAGWREALHPGGAVLVTDGVFHTWRVHLRRFLHSLRPGGDHNYVRRTLDHRAALARLLPHWGGLSAADARGLLLAAGFTEPQRFDHLLDAQAHLPMANFFIAGAHKLETGSLT